MMLGAFRKSGCVERDSASRLIVSERILGGRSPQEGDLVDRCTGQIRTYNREVNGKDHLEINVFIRELYCWGAKSIRMGFSAVQGQTFPIATRYL